MYASSYRAFLMEHGGLLSFALMDKLDTDFASREVSVTTFGAVGDGTTDDTAAFLAAIAFCESFSPPLTLFVPPGQYKISSTLTWSVNGFSMRGAGYASWLRPTMLGGWPCIKVAASVNYWNLSDFRIEATINTTNFLAGTASAQFCTGLEAYQTGSNFIARYSIQNVYIRGCWIGARLGGFIANIQNLFILYCELGLEATLWNAVKAVLRFEECRKDFTLTDSNGFHLDNLMAEGSGALATSSTIDNCDAFRLTAPYWEWSDTHPRAYPYLTIGGTTQCKRVSITDARIVGSSGLATGVTPLVIDRAQSIDISFAGSPGSQRHSVSTTTNTTDLRLTGVGVGAFLWIQDNSKQLGSAFNYFPNRQFDLWFRGWTQFAAVRCAMAKETTLVRKGVNAVRLTGTAGQAENNGTWILTGDAVTALRGKRVRMCAWIWIPDIPAFSESAQTLYPTIKASSENGVTVVSATAESNHQVVASWNFFHVELDVQVDATQLDLAVYVNDSATVSDGTEYVVVDEITYCEATVPLTRQRDGDALDSPMILSRAEGGRLIQYDTAAPSDTAQTYVVGDKWWKTNVAAAGIPGGVCTTAGAGGTAVFKNMAAVAA